MSESEVHALAREVLSFWFEDVTDAQRFARSATLDAFIATRFGRLRDALLAGRAAGWRDHPDTLLAAIVLLDQFSRNIHRGSPEAFAADPLARELTLHALAQGWDKAMTAVQRQFVCMPLMHAEDRELQTLSIAKFAELGDPGPLAFAQQHAEVIARFGRFPSRNAALGRASTPAEEEYLSQPGAGW